MHIALWILQGLLGLLFVWAGGFKLVVPIATMTGSWPLLVIVEREVALALRDMPSGQDTRCFVVTAPTPA